MGLPLPLPVDPSSWQPSRGARMPSVQRHLSSQCSAPPDVTTICSDQKGRELCLSSVSPQNEHASGSQCAFAE